MRIEKYFMKLMKWGVLTLVLLCTTLNAVAQKLQFKDTEGNPVGFVNVLSHSGTVVGMSDSDGAVDITPMASSIEGKPVTVTHIAFKPQTFTVGDATSVRDVILEDASFEIPEVTVTPKDYIYVQTYYRMLYMQDDTVLYYRSGLIDNTYDVKKKSLKTDSHHFSKAIYGVLKFAIDKLTGSTLEGYADLPELNDNKGKSKFEVTEETPGRERVSYKGKLVGYNVLDLQDRQKRLSVDMDAVKRIHYEELEKEKKLKRMDNKKNVKNNYYRVYQTDSEGHYGVEDFMMTQWLDDYDKVNNANNKSEHIRIWIESFSTDRAYVTKQELKERKKANRREMTISSMRQFEQEHNIPPYAPQIQQRLDVLFKKAK